MNAIKITSDNKVSIIKINKPYEDYKKNINGWPEYIKPRFASPGTVLVVDDNGLMKNLPVNKAGSLMYGTLIHNNPIVGDILVIKFGFNGNGEPDCFALNDEEAQSVMNELLSEYDFLIKE